MNTCLKILLLVILCSYCSIKVAAQERNDFPKNWVGKWKGILHWHQGLVQRDPVPMELHILPEDSTDHYSWRLIYGSQQSDNRPYLLKPFDKSKGHWLIDERNSIVMDQFLVGDRFTGVFTVQGNTIINNCWLSGDSLTVEFYNYQERPIALTGGGDSTIPKVKTYGVRSYQRAILRRY